MLQQLIGMVHYEALMVWRRRTILVICGFFVVGIMGLSSLSESVADALNESLATDAPPGSLPSWFNEADLDVMLTSIELLIILAPGVIVLLLAIPPLLAEVIALDGHVKVRELLDGQRVSNAAYLAGKVLSVWAGLVIGLAGSAVAIGIFAALRIGTFDLWMYIRYWTLIVIPATLITAAVAVLAGGLARDRRVAVFIGIILLPFSVWVGANILARTYFSNILLAFSGETIVTSFDDLLNNMFAGAIPGMLPFVGVLVAVWAFVWAIYRIQRV
ncbi:MAG: hypothetical protein H7Y11_13690 [Armatimonadetes bacterium]|nr:hypothetical protein [Anaerolineae bacterium]